MTGQALKNDFWKTERIDLELEELQMILEQKKMRLYLQPILSLADNSIVGFEALTRGPMGSVFEQADALFSAAQAYDLHLDAEYSAMSTALNALHLIPDNRFLAINVGPELLLSKRFLDIAHLCQYAAEQIIFELTEHVPFTEIAALSDRIDLLENLGYRVALDDTGCGFADIELARKLRPSIVKICMATVHRITASQSERRHFESVYQDLKQQGIVLLGEGIESEQHTTALQALGVTLGQGYLFSKPKPLERALQA